MKNNCNYNLILNSNNIIKIKNSFFNKKPINKQIKIRKKFSLDNCIYKCDKKIYEIKKKINFKSKNIFEKFNKKNKFLKNNLIKNVFNIDEIININKKSLKLNPLKINNFKENSNFKRNKKIKKIIIYNFEKKIE